MLKLTHVLASGYEERVKMPPRKKGSLSSTKTLKKNKAAAKAAAKANAAAKELADAEAGDRFPNSEVVGAVDSIVFQEVCRV